MKIIWAIALSVLLISTAGCGITGKVIQSATPTYGNARVTHYYTPSEEDFSQWRNQQYKTDEGSSYYCKIPQTQRGFYEEVKCQGSGAGTDGKIYTYTTIKPTKQDSITTKAITTATGTEAKPHRTIAAAPDMIQYGSKVYIKFKDCKDQECCSRWEGEYTAEDTGSAMAKDWEKGIAHIDLYTGIGKESLQDAACLPDYAELYIEGRITKESIGTYAVRPSFEAETDYSLLDYYIVKNGLDKIKTECVEAGAQDMTECIKQKTKELSTSGYSWSAGSCEKGEKALFYSFVEAYKNCYFSLEDDCICRYEIPKDRIIQGEYQIYLEDAGVYLAKTSSLEQELEGHRYYTDQSGEWFKPTEAELSISIKLSNSQIQEQKLQSLDVPDKEMFTMYKKEGKVAIMTGQTSQVQKPECKTTQQNFQFCVANNNKRFPKTDENGKLSTEPVVYKFAAIFEDKTAPPKITDLSVEDMIKAEKSLTLTWSKSEAGDVNHYKVYISNETFDNITKAENIAAVRSDENTITANITVEDDAKEYYIAVTAVDNSNNELETVTSVPGISIDDLRPEKPEVTSAKEGDKLKFQITMPTKNEDGSEIAADEELTAYIFAMPNENTCGENILLVEKTLIGKETKGNTLTYETQYSKGCYGFIVKDKKGAELGRQDKDELTLVNIIQINE